MPAAVSKTELRAICTKEYAKLETVIDKVPVDLRYAPDDDGITPKDILGHRAHWIGLTLGWYLDGAAGKSPAIPAPGYKWSELKSYNARLREQQADLDWDEALALLRGAHDELIAQIDALDDQVLYGGPMAGGGNHWTTGRYFEAAGASHYRSGAKYLRSRIRAVA